MNRRVADLLPHIDPRLARQLDEFLARLTPADQVRLGGWLLGEAFADVLDERGKGNPRKSDASTHSQPHIPSLPPPKVVLLTVPQAAKQYPVGQNRLYRAVHAGEIDRIPFGNRILLRPEAIEEWLLKQETAISR